MDKNDFASLASMIGNVTVGATKTRTGRKRNPSLVLSPIKKAQNEAVDELPEDDFTTAVAESINAWAAMYHSRTEGDSSRLSDIDAANTRLILAHYDADPFISVTNCVREKGYNKHDDVIAKRIMLVMTHQQRAIQADIDSATSPGSLDH